MSGTLYLCATPIGNLEDITFRVINTLKEVDFKTYEFSSYRTYILGEDAQKQELLELLFFDKDNFEYVHNNLKVSNFEFLGE